jgi:signal transduction histidine kinase
VKVATKLAAAFALHILLLAALLIYNVRTIRDVVSTGYQLTEISSRVYSTATEQAARIAQLEENAAKHLVTRDSGYLSKFGELAAAFTHELEGLRAQPLTRREQTELTAITTQWQAFGGYAARLDQLAAGGPGAVDSLAALQLQLDTLRVQTQRMSEASHAAMLAQLGHSANAARRAERLSWIAAGGAILLSVLISVLIVRSITDALSRLAVGTREVARGRFGYRLATDRDDEFAQVARDFNVMTERLDELDRMKRDFVSKVSHDLKTPLASMQETIDVLLDELPGPLGPKQRRLLELNYQSGERLYAMLGKLLDLSRLEAGVFEPQIERCDLRALIQDAADTHSRPDAPVHVDGPDEPLPIGCDRDRVLQLLHNLVENAVKFASPGGVRIDAAMIRELNGETPPLRWAAVRNAAPLGAAHIVVCDDGPGVPDADKKRVFERFFQGAAGRATRARGVGLGLTICREIVAVHNGAIWIEDRTGCGSEFHVLIPDAVRAHASAAAPEEDEVHA